MSAVHSLDEQVRGLLDGYAGDPAAARQNLSALLTAEPQAFRAAALAELPHIRDAQCRRFLLEAMLKRGLIPPCDSSLLSLEQEVSLARELLTFDSSLDIKLAKRFMTATDLLPEETAHRVLDLLAAISDSSRILPLLIRLLQEPSARVRSKAALVIGSKAKAARSAEALLAGNDERVRANAIEALWGVDTQKVRNLLRESADDPNNRVTGNALLGLFSLGDTGAIPRILKFAADPDPAFRATAAWIMEQTGCPRFLHSLAQMVRESDPRVRTRVFHAIAALKQANTRLAESRRLRVRILGVSPKADGQRTVHAAISSASGSAAALPPTGIVLWENARMVTEYAVRRIATPDSIALGLVCPAGEANDPLPGALRPLKRDRDRWSTARYTAGGILASMAELFNFLCSGPGARHILLHAQQLGEVHAADWAAILTQARTLSALIHTVGGSGTEAHHARTMAEQTGGFSLAAETPDETRTACEDICLGLLHAYEIGYRTSDKTSMHPELKLEVYADPGYGLDCSQF